MNHNFYDTTHHRRGVFEYFTYLIAFFIFIILIWLKKLIIFLIFIKTYISGHPHSVSRFRSLNKRYLPRQNYEKSYRSLV